MKTKTTANAVRNYFGKKRIISFGYCTIQGLENYLPQLSCSVHYTTGVYGWNADVFCIEGGGKFFAICTGYRPFGVYDERLSAVAEKYERRINAVKYEFKQKVAKEFIDELWDTLQEIEKN